MLKRPAEAANLSPDELRQLMTDYSACNPPNAIRDLFITFEVGDVSRGKVPIISIKGLNMVQYMQAAVAAAVKS